MPLEKGRSKEVIGNNIGIEKAAGKPPAQAAAIAYSQARKYGKKDEEPNYSKKALQHPNILGAGAAKRAHIKDPEKKIATVEEEFKRGKLHSGSGAIVKKPSQAIAIGISEARSSGATIPKKDISENKKWKMYDKR